MTWDKAAPFSQGQFLGGTDQGAVNNQHSK